MKSRTRKSFLEQGRCGSYRGCEYFSYYTSNNECYMKTSAAMKRPNPDVISGKSFSKHKCSCEKRVIGQAAWIGIE